MNKNLQSSFSNVLKKLQIFSQMNLSELNQTELKSSQEQMKHIIKKHSSSSQHSRLINEFFHFGPIEKLIQKEQISEILINGKDHIFYEEAGKLEMLNDQFLSKLTFNNFVHRICEESQMIVGLNQPFVDGHWNGWRIHLSRAPLVHVDFHISMRRHPKNPWTFQLLKERGWGPQSAISLIKALIDKKKNILIVGPTSSGKTSVLNACLQCLPEKERVITIEDNNELLLPNFYSTKLLTRNFHEENLLDVDQSELVRQSLRMRPDRIVMGETRGPEAKDLIMALATGHKGSIGTIHARDHKQALWRLEMLVQMGAPSWNTSTIQQMIALSIDHLILLDRCEGERQLRGVYKLSGIEKTGYLFETLFTSQLDAQLQELFPMRERGS